MVRILTGWYPVMQRLCIQLFTHIKTNTVPLGRCGFDGMVSIVKITIEISFVTVFSLSDVIG